MFEFTMLKTFAAAYASPVRISAPPSPVEVATFLPVSASTTTLLVTRASFVFRISSALELRHVVIVQPDGYTHSSGPMGLEPCPPSKKYERSYWLISTPLPSTWLRRRTMPSELKKLAFTMFITFEVDMAFPDSMVASPVPPRAMFSPVDANDSLFV